MSVGLLFFFKQKTAYDMRISDWSSDVCSSDLVDLAIMGEGAKGLGEPPLRKGVGRIALVEDRDPAFEQSVGEVGVEIGQALGEIGRASCRERVCQYV